MSLSRKRYKTLKRKNSMEDVGFISKIDPWNYLSDYYGKPFRDYRKKWGLVSNFELESDFPMQLDFELNNNCNLSCEMCTWSIEKRPKTNYFPEEKFKELVTDGVGKGLASLGLSVVNEPLIRKDLPGLIEFSRKAGVLDVAFNTNGTLLNENMSTALLGSGLTRIQFSLDAHSAKVYNHVRRGGDYKKVLKNILVFLDKKAEKGVRGLLTAVSFVRMSVNEHEMDAFIAFWRDKVDYILIREYLSPYGKSSPVFFKDKKKLFANKRHMIRNFRCDKPWQRLAIRSDGTALPCCVFYATHLPVGNVFKQSIDEIWHSDKMRSLRSLHKKGEYYKNKTCRECAICSTADSTA